MSAFPGEIYRNALESCLSSRVATKHRNIFQDNLIDEQIWRNFSNKSFPAGSANLDEVVRCGCTLTQKHRGKKTLNTVHKRKEKSQEYFTANYTAQRKTNTTDKIDIKQHFVLDEKSLTGGKYLKNEMDIVKISKILNNIVAR